MTPIELVTAYVVMDIIEFVFLTSVSLKCLVYKLEVGNIILQE